MFHATACFSHPAHAAEWGDPGLGSALDRVCTVLLEGLRAGPGATPEGVRRTPRRGGRALPRVVRRPPGVRDNEGAMTAPTEHAPPAFDGPVTVAITRKVAPADTVQMIAWVRRRHRDGRAVPGFLGAGWVRPRDASDEWHMLYRFADAASLGSLGFLPERRWWLRSGEGLVERARSERRTGVEGWFDPPVERRRRARRRPGPRLRHGGSSRC